MASLMRWSLPLLRRSQSQWATAPLKQRPLTCACRSLSSVQPDHLTQPDASLQSDAPVSKVRPVLPLMTSRKLARVPIGSKPKQAWLETLESIEDEKLGIIDLHPDVFATFPRVDILWWNVYWQKMYRHVNYDFVKNRAEMKGGGRKPWPQKGTGRARHGSIRSPLWIRGGKSFGPRGPTSYFFMLTTSMRALGLRVALSVKYAQNDLHIVDSLDIPTDDPKYLEELIESRGWGLSVLFVDDTDIIPRNFAAATDKIKSYNVMPTYGLNVHSILKHETLVLTLASVEKLEEKLLYQMHKEDFKDHQFDRSQAIYQTQRALPK